MASYQYKAYPLQNNCNSNLSLSITNTIGPTPNLEFLHKYSQQPYLEQCILTLQNSLLGFGFLEQVQCHFGLGWHCSERADIAGHSPTYKRKL